eukprot:7387782-Prymnesium_polylepis.1
MAYLTGALSVRSMSGDTPIRERFISSSVKRTVAVSCVLSSRLTTSRVSASISSSHSSRWESSSSTMLRMLMPSSGSMTPAPHESRPSRQCISPGSRVFRYRSPGRCIISSSSVTASKSSAAAVAINCARNAPV